MKHASEAFVVGSHAAVESVGDGIRRQILGYDHSLMVARVEFETGARGDIHAHPHSQVSYVESGEFLVSIGGKEQLLGPGDSFYVEPHIDHGAVCRKSGVLLDVFSPVREDFLGSGEGQ
ncbi:MAG: cupin domain-containing protein [Pseudomonadota bacterium]